MLLGTPVPSGEGLRLERTLSRSELERNGVWPPERIEASAAVRPEVWQEVTLQGPVIGEPLLSRLFRQGGWCWKGWPGGIVLYRRWQENTPFPAMPVFCFVRMERGGIFCWLDGKGNPCFPPE